MGMGSIGGDAMIDLSLKGDALRAIMECDLCNETFEYDLGGTVTECGTVVCQNCCDEGEVYWISCYEQGESWSHLA